MIISTMTPIDIQHEIDKDYVGIALYIVDMYKKYLRALKNIRKFPYETHAYYVSPTSNIKYTIVQIAFNKYRLKSPHMYIYTKYAHDDGSTYIYIYNPQPQQTDITLVTTHFLKRYRERMHLDQETSLDQIFERYCKINSYSNEFDGILVDKAGKYKNSENSEYFGEFVLEGLTICERFPKAPNINVKRTFVSPDLLFEEQDHKARLTYIVHRWRNFSDLYPPQRDKLNELFDEWANDESISDLALLNKINAFIENY